MYISAGHWINVLSLFYWTGREDATHNGGGWGFDFDYGEQHIDFMLNTSLTLTVHSGDVGAMTC